MTTGHTVLVGDVGVALRAGGRRRRAALLAAADGLPRSTGPPSRSIEWSPRPLRHLPDRAPDMVIDSLDTWWDGEGQLRLSAYRHWHAQADDTAATVHGPRVGASPALSWLVQLLLMHLLASADRFVLHAAGVGHGDEAWVVLGPTGAGKSTLVAAAAEAGWVALSDDQVVLRPGAAGIEVMGLQQRLAIPSDLGGSLASQGRLRGRDGRRRVVIPPSALADRWFRVAGVLVACHGSDEVGALVPLAGPTAMGHLMRSTMLVGDQPALGRFFPAAAAVARLPAFELHHALTSRNRLAAAATHLRALAR
jgi:hypothetical protein